MNAMDVGNEAWVAEIVVTCVLNRDMLPDSTAKFVANAFETGLGVYTN